MRRRLLGVLSAGMAVGVAAGPLGCSSPNRNRAPIKPVGSVKGDDGLSEPKLPPSGGSSSGTTAGNGRGVLAGFVYDPDGKKARDVPVEVELTSGAGNSAAIEVLTDTQGYFQVKRLETKQAYTVTARAKIDGREVAGCVYASTGTDRSQFLTINLAEGLNFPKSKPKPPDDLPGRGAPAPGRGPLDLMVQPPSVQPDGGAVSGLSSPRPSSAVRDGDDYPAATPPAERPRPTIPELPTAGPPPRPDLQTRDRDAIFRPPAAAIPPVREARALPAAAEAEFALLNLDGSPREFPDEAPGKLVLLEFMTTWCGPCKKTVPLLKKLQAEYRPELLEVVAVVSDELPRAERLKVAAAYKTAYDLTYTVAIEPAAKPGTLLDRFEVKAYPTLILVDGRGKVLWRGHADEFAELRKVVEGKQKR